MKFQIQVAALLAAVAATSASVLQTPENNKGTFELLILHNNDMHARFEQTSQHSGTCTDAEAEAGRCYGGFARVATVVKEARKAAADGTGPPVLYLNAGDTYTGTIWFNLYKWRIAAEFINLLQPDAMSLGNNELQQGSSELSPLLKNVDTKIIATNVIVKGQDEILQKSLTFDVEGTKLALVGYLTPQTNVLDSAGTIEYIDEIIALKDEVAKLKAQGINIIIALGHSSLEKDLEIAREVEGLDLVIAGHKNSYMWNGDPAEDQENNRTIEVTQQSGKQVPVVQSYAYNKFLGKIQAQFNADGDINTYTVESIMLDESVPQDSESLAKIKSVRTVLGSRSQEVVGQTAVVLEGNSCQLEECNLGNLIADAINYYHAVRFTGERWTDAPVTIIPGGYLSGSIAPSNRPADVTLGDLLAAVPRDDNIVAVTMNGNILLQLLEHSVSNYQRETPTDEFLQFSGIRVVYDFSKENGSRIVSSFVRCWSCWVPEFYTIDDWRTYKIMMPESMADGEYGYTMLQGLPKEELGYSAVACAAEFIGARSPVYPEIAGRIEFRNYDSLPEPEPGSAIAVTSRLTIISLTILLLIL